MKALASACAAFLLVNAVLGGYVVKTLPRVDNSEKRLTAGLCVQIANAQAAIDREEKLEVGDPKNITQHIDTATRLKKSVEFLRPLVRPGACPKKPDRALPPPKN